MKKTIIAMTALLLLFMISCSHRTNPTDPFGPSTTQTAVSTPVNTPVVYTNNGRIKSTGLDTYIDMASMTIDAAATYYYDAGGKIRYLAESVGGISEGNINYNYNANGKLISKINPAGSGADNTYYGYDSSNRLSTLMVVTDSTTTTKMAQTFTYDGNNRISRIDESDNGTPSSYRIITRNASGYEVSEIIYIANTTTVMGNITFTRNDAAKTILVALTLTGMPGDSLDVVFAYDSTGFTSSETIIMPILGMNMTITNTLQSGSFDAAGMNGFYYTDPDVYGMTYISATGSAG